MTNLKGFDGIRAIACLCVIVFHLTQRLDAYLLPSALQELQSIILLGNIGVSIFFVLSGGLLSYPFWQNWLSGDDPPSLRTYAIKRLVRIAPGFYLSLLVSFVLSLTLFGHKLDSQLLVRFLSGMAFVGSFHWLTFFPVEINGPLWSIGFEVFAYFLLALFMMAMFRFIKRRKMTTGIVYWIGITSVCLAINLAIVGHLIPSDEGRGWQYGLIGGAKSWMPWYNPIGLFNHFVLGIFAGGFLCYMQRARVKSHWFIDAMVIVVWILIGAFLLSHRHDYTGFDGVLGNIYFWPWFPLAIAMSLCFLPFTRLMGGALDNRFLRYIAKISFGLYIWHALVIEVLHATLFPDFYFMGMKTLSAWLLPMFLSVLLSVAIAALSYKYVERPALKWGHKQALAAPKFPASGSANLSTSIGNLLEANR